MINPNNMMQMIQEFAKFKQNFSGNPKEEVQKLLQSGRISQKQLNDVQNMARQLQSILNNK